MKNETEDSPRKEINTTKYFWLFFFFNLEKHYTIMLGHAKSQSAHQAPLSRAFSRQEYWSGLPCLPPGDLSDPGIKPPSLKSPALAGEFLTT